MNNILNDTSKTTLPQGAPRDFKSVMIGNRGVTIDKRAAQSYFRAISVLKTKCSDAGKIVSNGYLVDALDKFVVELKFEDQNKVKSEIYGRINDLFRQVTSISLDEHLFLIPIMNMKLAQDLSIGATTFLELDAARLQVLESQNGSLRLPTESLQGFVDRMIAANETSTFAIVKVQATDSDMALAVSVQMAEMSLDVLRTFNDLSTNLPVVLREELPKLMMVDLSHKDLTTNTLGLQRRAVNLVPSIPFLNSQLIGRINTGFLSKVNPILLKPSGDLSRHRRISA